MKRDQIAIPIDKVYNVVLVEGVNFTIEQQADMILAYLYRNVSHGVTREIVKRLFRLQNQPFRSLVHEKLLILGRTASGKEQCYTEEDVIGKKT